MVPLQRVPALKMLRHLRPMTAETWRQLRMKLHQLKKLPLREQKPEPAQNPRTRHLT
jgi:hypothetical protein